MRAPFAPNVYFTWFWRSSRAYSGLEVCFVVPWYPGVASRCLWFPGVALRFPWSPGAAFRCSISFTGSCIGTRPFARALLGGAPTIAEPDQSSKLRPGPASQNPIVHLDPIWQHLARAHSAKPNPGATLQNPTMAYSAEPDLTNRDPSRQPASQSQSQRASRP